MQKKFLIIVLILGLFLTTSCGKNDENALKFKEEYEALNGTEVYGNKVRDLEISADNPFVYKTAGEIVKAMEDEETFVVYFGFASCPWCRSVLSTLVDVAKEQEIEEIYYVDVKDIRDELIYNEETKAVEVKSYGDEDYTKLLELLDDVLAPYELTDNEGNIVETDEKRIYAPNVVVVKEGNALGLETGISEKLDNPFGELTDEIINDTKKTYQNLFAKLNESNACSRENGC